MFCLKQGFRNIRQLERLNYYHLSHLVGAGLQFQIVGNVEEDYYVRKHVRKILVFWPNKLYETVLSIFFMFPLTNLLEVWSKFFGIFLYTSTLPLVRYGVPLVS